MTHLKKPLLIVFICLFSIASKAQLSGCLFNGLVYTQPPNFILDYWTVPLGRSPFDCPRAINVVQVPGLLPICTASNILGIGVEVTYARLDPPIGCPIDDYLPFLFISLSGIAIYRFRSLTLLN